METAPPLHYEISTEAAALCDSIAQMRDATIEVIKANAGGVAPMVVNFVRVHDTDSVVIAARPVQLPDGDECYVLELLHDADLGSPLWKRTKRRFERAELSGCQGAVVRLSVLAHLLPALRDGNYAQEILVEDTLTIEWETGSTCVVRTNTTLPGTLTVEAVQSPNTVDEPVAYHRLFQPREEAR